MEYKSFENKIRFLCKIKNCQRKNNVLLTGAKLLHPYAFYSLEDPQKLLENGNALELEPGIAMNCYKSNKKLSYHIYWGHFQLHI